MTDQGGDDGTRRVFIAQGDRWISYSLYDWDEPNAELTEDELLQVQEAEAAYDAAQVVLKRAWDRRSDAQGRSVTRAGDNDTRHPPAVLAKALIDQAREDGIGFNLAVAIRMVNSVLDALRSLPVGLAPHTTGHE